MVRRFLILAVYGFMLTIMSHATALAGLEVNEVLSNEPGSSITLEWFELFNDNASSANLAFYQITVGSNLLQLPDTGGPIVIPPRSYLVICRNLFTIGSSPGFESIWGNNSGVWGDDSVRENYPVIEASFGLPNVSGSVQLSGLSQSILSWTQAGTDGVSWERLTPTSDSIAPSTDIRGATPGQVNAITPVAFDLDIDTVAVSMQNDSTTISVSIVNRGTNSVVDADLLLRLVGDGLNPVDSLLDSIPLPFIGVGFTSLVVRRYLLSGMYTPMTAVLSEDDRPANNRRSFLAPGRDYPPVIINEFLANPQGNIQAEWVELKSTQDTAIDLTGWSLGDALGLAPVPPSGINILPHDYLVLTNDSLSFLDFYLSFTGSLIELNNWRALNNDGDIVRLIDPFGIEASRFAYSDVFADNVTWSRGETGAAEGVWGRADTAGGTPGTINRVRVLPNANALRVTVTPRIISPDGDGHDDEALIRITAPRARGFTVKLFDREGRTIRTFEDNAPDLAAEYRWDGKTDGGSRLPIGVYILYVEAQGVESFKQTIVVAR